MDKADLDGVYVVMDMFDEAIESFHETEERARARAREKEGERRRSDVQRFAPFRLELLMGA